MWPYPDKVLRALLHKDNFPMSSILLVSKRVGIVQKIKEDTFFIFVLAKTKRPYHLHIGNQKMEVITHTIMPMATLEWKFSPLPL